jgi:hypothetical protein
VLESVYLLVIPPLKGGTNAMIQGQDGCSSLVMFNLMKVRCIIQNRGSLMSTNIFRFQLSAPLSPKLGSQRFPHLMRTSIMIIMIQKTNNLLISSDNEKPGLSTDVIQEAVGEGAPRRSTRVSRQPVHLKNFVTYYFTQHAIQNCIRYDRISSNFLPF